MSERLVFGDEKTIAFLKSAKREKNMDTCRITIDLRTLVKIGVDRLQARDLIKRLLKLKK